MTARARGVPNLLKKWDEVAARVRGHAKGPIVIFLDFDGTLVDIAPRPELVRLKPNAKRPLQRLARHSRTIVAVISGRRRAELLQHIGIRGLRYFGLYGSESSAASPVTASASAALRRALRQLEEHLHAYPTAWIENKQSSLSVHLLDVPRQLQPRLRRKLRLWLKPFRATLHAAENLRDVEILPRSIQGKGAAVRRLLAQPAFRGAFPFYFGDDFSDESGFVAVRRGISVHVGPGRSTRAQYRVRNPAEVAAALSKLHADLSQNTKRPSKS